MLKLSAHRNKGISVFSKLMAKRQREKNCKSLWNPVS